jgi:hypothetical protein
MGDPNPPRHEQLKNPLEPGADAHEAVVESRWEAGPAVGLIVLLQAVIATVSRSQSWTLGRLPWWSWLALALPELSLAARRSGNRR